MPVRSQGMLVAALAPGEGPVLQRLGQLRTYGDPRQIVSGWVRLCARLLGLGWVGAAYGPGNLVVPEGLKSLELLSAIVQLEELREAEAAIELTLASLAEGVAAFLGAPRESALQPVRRELYDCCREQSEAGELLPPPLLQAVLRRPAFDLIVDRLR